MANRITASRRPIKTLRDSREQHATAKSMEAIQQADADSAGAGSLYTQHFAQPVDPGNRPGHRQIKGCARVCGQYHDSTGRDFQGMLSPTIYARFSATLRVG